MTINLTCTTKSKLWKLSSPLLSSLQNFDLHHLFCSKYPKENSRFLLLFGPTIMSERDSHTSSDESHTPTKPKHHGRKAKRFEPLYTTPITSSPMILSCFQDVGCYHFCEKVKQVEYHPDLTRLFSCSPQNHQFNLAGVQFELSSEIISKVTSIPDVGELWFKEKTEWL